MKGLKVGIKQLQNHLKNLILNFSDKDNNLGDDTENLKLLGEGMK